MGVRKRYQAFVIGVVLIFTLGLFVGRQQAKMYGEVGADPSGHVSVKAFRDGAVFYEYEQHNLITTIGSKHLRNFLGFANQTDAACIYLSLSDDGAPAASWTKLPFEIAINGLDRATGDPTVVNATAYQVTYTWTATDTDTVDCTGLHWSATGESDGNMFAAAAISSVSLQDQDQLQVTWTVNIPDN